MAEKHVDIKSLQAALYQWWRDLENKKGDRAALRRSRDSPTVIRYAKQYVEVSRKIGSENSISPSLLLPILGLLSHVKRDSTEKIKDYRISLAQAMARSKGNNSVVSELRFQRILQARDRNELYPLLLRAIRLLDGEVNVSNLIYSVYFWGDAVRKQWALDYYRNQTTT